MFKRNKKSRPCQFGVFQTCGKPSVTTRPRPKDYGKQNAQHWYLCQTHAEFLDRVRANIQKHKALLERLGD